MKTGDGAKSPQGFRSRVPWFDTRMPPITLPDDCFACQISTVGGHGSSGRGDSAVVRLLAPLPPHQTVSAFKILGEALLIH